MNINFIQPPILLLFLIVIGVIFNKRRLRRRALTRPLPQAWIAIIRQNLPPYAKLSPKMQQQLQEYTQEFLYDKSFEGCGGLELDDEIKVTIAAQASLLLLNRKVRNYPKLFSVLVYPSTYVVKNDQGQGSIRLGESWRTGAVVLAWDSVKHGAANFNDGHNVTMHVFAHQLDQHYGAADGAPVLASRSAYSAWAQVFSKEYELLRMKTATGRKSVMDAYGANNPAEFFAVATETFFEKPVQLKRNHPELYEELYSFYRVSPIEWE